MNMNTDKVIDVGIWNGLWLVVDECHDDLFYIRDSLGSEVMVDRLELPDLIEKLRALKQEFDNAKTD